MDDFRQAAGLDRLAGSDSVALARTAAEAVRGLNRATSSPAGLDRPSVAYDVVGALSLAASRLPQLLAQLGSWLAAALEAGLLGCDDGSDPGAAVGGAAASLSGARASAGDLAAALGRAQQHLAAVHGRPATAQEQGENS